jgi:hypothetical protein
MSRTAIVIAAAFAVAVTLPAASAQAQTRVFVAGTGSDANPCTFALPCRTFQHAHDTVAANGEIDVLDPAGYGALTIAKSISIQGHGYAGITASNSASAITVNAGASDVIILQGLTLDGVNSGLDGILFNTGASLKVFDCSIKNFLYNGIYVGALHGMSLLITNTVITGISSTTNSSAVYFYNGSSGGLTVAALDNLTLSDNSVGISLYAIGGPVEALISNSQILNAPVGLVTQGLSSNAAVTVALKNDKFNFNSVGIHLVGYTAAYLSQITQLTVPGISFGIALDGAGNSAFTDGTNHFTTSPGVTFGTWSSQ